MSFEHYCKTVKFLHKEADRLADMRVELLKDFPNVGIVKEVKDDTEMKRKQIHRHIRNTFPGCGA